VNESKLYEMDESFLSVVLAAIEHAKGKGIDIENKDSIVEYVSKNYDQDPELVKWFVDEWDANKNAVMTKLGK
ncbi:MAG: hypothetical protein JRI80_19535, partial [Deltaproteobacteria bacterium]|nr:hypothetical protein [Deltaproteobacteria bacterium]